MEKIVLLKTFDPTSCLIKDEIHRIITIDEVRNFCPFFCSNQIVENSIVVCYANELIDSIKLKIGNGNSFFIKAVALEPHMGSYIEKFIKNFMITATPEKKLSRVNYNLYNYILKKLSHDEKIRDYENHDLMYGYTKDIWFKCILSHSIKKLKKLEGTYVENEEYFGLIENTDCCK